MSSFFIEWVKNKYKYVPGQQSTFEIIINIVSTIIFSIEFIGLVFIIILIYVKGNDLNIINFNVQHGDFNYTGLDRR